MYLTAGDAFICFCDRFDRAVGTYEPSDFSLKVHGRGDSTSNFFLHLEKTFGVTSSCAQKEAIVPYHLVVLCIISPAQPKA